MAQAKKEMTTRKATRRDSALVLQFIQKLAAYEKRPQDVSATAQRIEQELFDRQRAHVLLAELDGAPIGYALYYTVFGSFAAKSYLYLEDLFIDPSLRGKGYGKQLLRCVAHEAGALHCHAMQWSCLDWNTPSIEFYESLGAKQKSGTVGFVLEGGALQALAGQ